MEIGNRKKRLAFLYEFPGLKSLRQVWAAAHQNPEQKNIVSEQDAKQPAIETVLKRNAPSGNASLPDCFFS